MASTPRKLKLSVFARLTGKSSIDGQIVDEPERVIVYDIIGLPPYDAANVFMTGSLDEPVWQVQRWIDGEYKGHWGKPFPSPQAAVDALEQESSKLG
jgi:hypothetical protein